MKITFDLHTHTTYSHGTGSIEDNARSAKEKGISGIAITDHGFSHPIFGMRRRKLDEMREHCFAAAKDYGVEVRLGIESNIRGDSGKTDVRESDVDKLDVFLAGLHRFIVVDKHHDMWRMMIQGNMTETFRLKPTDGLVRYNTRCYINAIMNNPVDVITHLGFCSPCDPEEVAKCARDYGTYIEINTKKTHLSDEQWQKVIDTGVNFVVDSDAHSPARVGDGKLAEELFERVKFPMERIHNIDGRMPVLRFTEYKKHR